MNPETESRFDVGLAWSRRILEEIRGRGAVVIILACALSRLSAQIAVGSSNAAIGKVPPVVSLNIPGSSGPDADVAWQALLQAMSPNHAVPRLRGDMPEPRDLGDSGRLHQASLLANRFYTQFPKDSRAALARKYEAVTALQGAQLGSPYVDAANALGAAYRADTKNNSADDRLDVALAMQTVSLPASLNGSSLQATAAVQKTMIDSLEAEIGDTDRIYGLYVGLMRTADAATAQSIATQITKKSPPGWAKSQAQSTLARAALPGNSVKVTLSTVSGNSLSLSAPGHQVTVLFFWGQATRDLDFAALRAVAPKVVGGPSWIYEGLGTTNAGDANVSAIAPFPGEYCFEASGVQSTTATSFNVTQTPWVCVLNHNGKVSGSGRVVDLPALLAQAN